MKQSRQQRIVQLINENAIETQDELLSMLEAEGVRTTQATVSRDIRELNVKKVTYDGNKHKYVVGTGSPADASGSYTHVLERCIVSMEAAENIIVVKTVAGMAMAVGAALDSLEIEGIVGCIAGDDTLFLAIKNSTFADKIIGEIKHVAKYAY